MVAKASLQQKVQVVRQQNFAPVNQQSFHLVPFELMD